MKKLIKRALLALLVGIILYAIIYAWPRVPIITGLAAKGMCSSVFLAQIEPHVARVVGYCYYRDLDSL